MPKTPFRLTVALVAALAVLTPAAANAIPRSAPVGLYSVRLGDGQQFSGTTYLREGRSLSISLRGTEVYVDILKKSPTGAFEKVKTVYVPTGTVKVKLPVDNVYRKPVLNQTFKVTHVDQTKGIVTSSALNVRVYKKPVAMPKNAKGRWSTLNKSIVARWNPCKPITYKVDNYAAMGSNRKALRQAKAAIAHVSAQSGLTFVYKGRTKVTKKHPYAAGVDLTIQWDSLRGRRLAGWGGGEFEALNGADFMGMSRSFAVIDREHDRVGASRQHVLVHEITHGLGLGHSHNKRDVMGPRSHSRATYGYGDRVGMFAVGKHAGCF